MKSDLEKISIQLLLAILPIISAFIIRLINAKTIQIKENAKNKKLDNYLDFAQGIIAKSVIAVNQTFVETLKDSNSFTEEKQKEAFNMAKDRIFKILTEDSKKAIQMVYGDLNSYIDTQIELSVNRNKKH